jgi:hypothetical protein
MTAKIRTLCDKFSDALIGQIQSIGLRQVDVSKGTLAVSLEIGGCWVEVIRTSQSVVSQSVSRARIVAEIAEQGGKHAGHSS